MKAKRWMTLFGGSLLFAFGFASSPVQAQDEDVLDESGEVEEIVVTGSRIRRDEFSSPSPIQVLDVESGKQLGISSIGEMLQRATVANGQQIDATLNTNAGNSNATEEPPTGGVGSSNIDLRALGPERTLVLVNGRRLGSVGVRGAPAQPDIGLIPFSMVERVEVLTEGVSAVYGADAVAGVANVILRTDFEGFEISMNTEQPSEKGGNINQISMIAGAQGDRARITFAAEMFDRQRVLVGDRDYTHCYRQMKQFRDGSIESVCYNGFYDNVFINLDYYDPDYPGFGQGDRPEYAFFFNPGLSAAQSDIGIANFSSYAQIGSAPDGYYDYGFSPTAGTDNQRGSSNFPYFDFYNDNDERRMGELVGEINRVSAVTTGSVDLDLWSNEQVFFEAYYLQSTLFSIAATEQIFPDVPGMIPQEDDNGNIIVDAEGFPILVDNPLNPFAGDMAPIITLDSLPQTRDVERNQYRFVLGLRGDLGDSSWSYEGFYSYDRGIGFQAQPILFENHLVLATQTVRLNADGEPICGIVNPTIGLGSFDTTDTCVPIDWNDPNLYIGGPNGEGVFTDAAVDYLIGNRTNRTVVEQTMIGAFATGDLFQWNGRTIGAAIGAEYREDEISSQNDISGVLGLNAAENPLQEGETFGSRDVFEVFGEVNVPILDNLDFDAAVRYTDEEFFGTETTWRARLAWRALDHLTLSASAGTSFRAPNLREQFLADQGGGVSGGLDPCISNNINALQPGPDKDLVIQNCILAGVVFVGDTTVLGTQGVTTIPTSTGGTTVLKAETSDSHTATMQVSQWWSDSYDFDMALSYWSVEIENSVEEPTAGFIINQCYTNPDFPGLTSPYCALTGRPGGSNPASNILNFVDISFINIGEQTAKGIDLNTRLMWTIDRLGVDLSWATALTKQLEAEYQVFGPADRDDNLGEIGVPEYKFTSTLSLRRGDWEVLLQNRYIGDGQQDNTDEWAFYEYWDGPWGEGPDARDVDFVDSIWYTDMSLTYFSDQWTISVGVNNLFDEEPPLIDVNEGPNRNNAVTSAGYDFFGRSFFLTAGMSF